MKIAVVGTGGVGGYFGGLLARSGHDVAFIARGAHRRAIRARGLRIESAKGAFTLAPADATDDPADIDGDPGRDSNGVVSLHAVALGPAEAVAIAEVTVARVAGAEKYCPSREASYSPG